jgi:hypothetical protein
MIDIKVYIRGKEVQLSSIINIFDMDTVEFEIIGYDNDYFSSIEVKIFLEDYEIPCVNLGDGLTLKSQINHLFRESFGYSNVRIFVDNEIFSELLFNVSTNEKKFENIKSMMTYLLQNNKRVLDLCFARTKYKSKNDGEFEASFDTIINLAENIVKTFNEKKPFLRQELRNRLELIKENTNEKNFYNINPYDVINNLDQLYQGYSPNSITLFGKVYSLDNIQRENHIDSYDLEENRILLGGLISIKEVLLAISDAIDKKLYQPTYDKEYEKIKPFYKLSEFSIDDLYAQLTTSGMHKRIESILVSTDELLYLFQRKLNINFEGFIPPKLTPFARKSSFYLTIYKCLGDWYSLGSPSIGIDHDLAKIRSTSKIYELFTLYKLIDALHSDGWKIIDSIVNSSYQRFIPSQVNFRKEDSSLNLYYEKKILGFNENTQHNDLVALNKNNPRKQYNYYNPDFIIVKQKQDDVSYYIFDSKYSSSNTLRNYKVLDNLYEKYFSNMATYDQVNNVLQKHSIKCVNAIHPFGEKQLTKWSNQLPQIIPDISSIFLSKDVNNLNRVLNLINQ